jgi:inorganic pyrophosphatase
VKVDVIVETPAGSRNKYELDPASGRMKLDRTLYASLRLPADYGFVVDTLSGDGDALDALVVAPEPTFPGCLVFCQPIAVLHMRDQAAEDSKILAVPATERMVGWHDLGDVPAALREEIGHFFTVYKSLDRDKWTEVVGWSGRSEAEREIKRAQARWRQGRPGGGRGAA